jgi:hypothetical protein
MSSSTASTLARRSCARAGELGAHEVSLPDRRYALAAGDEVIFTAALYSPGAERVENGTLATAVDAQRRTA